MKNTFNQEYIMKNFFKKVKNTLAHIPFMTDVIAHSEGVCFLYAKYSCSAAEIL